MIKAEEINIEKLKDLYTKKVINSLDFIEELENKFKDYNKNFDEKGLKCKSGVYLILEKIINNIKEQDKWAKIEGLEYLISNEGKILSLKSGKILTERTTGKTRKYVNYSLYDGQGENSYFSAHRLVAEYFVKGKSSEKIVVNHKDNNPLNNECSNLEWCTPSYNSKHGWQKEKGRKKKIFKTVYVTDIHSNECFVFNSVENASKFLDIDRTCVSHMARRKNKNKDYIIDIYSKSIIENRIDNKYLKLIKTIFKNGFYYEDPNRKGVKRLQIPNYTFSHYFRVEGFPVITCKKTFPEMALKELKMFLSGETNLKNFKEIGINFWDKDAYNFYKKQGGNLDFKGFLNIVSEKGFDLGTIYSKQMRNFRGSFDQIYNLIKDLKENPFKTKKTVTMWDPTEIDNSCLSPCHWSWECLIVPAKKNEKSHGLIIKWHQHSTDVFLGLPMNIMYYSLLCYFIAKYSGLRPHGIIADLSNVHLYENSLESAKKLQEVDFKGIKNNIKVKVNTKLSLDEAIKDFKVDFGNIEFGEHYKVPMLPYSV